MGNTVCGKGLVNRTSSHFMCDHTVRCISVVVNTLEVLNDDHVNAFDGFSYAPVTRRSSLLLIVKPYIWLKVYKSNLGTYTV